MRELTAYSYFNVIFCILNVFFMKQRRCSYRRCFLFAFCRSKSAFFFAGVADKYFFHTGIDTTVTVGCTMYLLTCINNYFYEEEGIR
jgi:hypothetical protein